MLWPHKAIDWWNNLVKLRCDDRVHICRLSVGERVGFYFRVYGRIPPEFSAIRWRYRVLCKLAVYKLGSLQVHGVVERPTVRYASHACVQLLQPSPLRLTPTLGPIHQLWYEKNARVINNILKFPDRNTRQMNLIIVLVCQYPGVTRCKFSLSGGNTLRYAVAFLGIAKLRWVFKL